MSHLRAPATRADRREGGRHGRPAARTAPTPTETHIRPQLLRLAVLPPVAVALAGCAAVLFTVRSTAAMPTPTLWAVLAGAFGVAVAGVLTAAVAAGRAADSVKERVDTLRRTATRGEADLRALVEALRRGETVPKRGGRGRPAADTSGADDFELLAADLARAQESAIAAVVRAAQLSSRAGNEQKLEVFLNLARRLQSLVHREISTLDELENEIEDPDLLKGLFHVDHLSTRIRRHAENLAVLGGAVSRRQWSNPVEMTEVLRSAIAEVEQYSRVRLVPPIDGRLRGNAVADVIHLLAELVENATVFSAPHTQVLLRANLVTSGLAVEVEDRGLGMPLAEQHRMNALLADPDQVNVASLLQDGRIGLYVVSQLARRHGIQVRLGTNIYGGVQAVLVLPADVLGTPPPELPATPAARGARPGGTAPGQGRVPGQGGAPAPGGTGGGGGTPPPGAPRGGGGAPVPGAPRTDGAGAPAHAGRGERPGPEGWVNPARHAGPTEHAGRTEPASAGVPAPGGRGRPSAGVSAFATDGAVAPVPAAPGAGTPAGPGTPGTGTPSGTSGTDGHGTPASAPAPGTGVDWVQVTASGTHGSGAVPGDTGSGGGHPGSGSGEPGGPPGTAPPLPVRGQRAARPSPAAAQPGLGAGHRRALAENTGLPPTPRVGPVRGTMGKPQLPRRRAQEHLAPQLRGGPAPGPRADAEAYVEHDPGLMAAFQRGIGLAEAAQQREPAAPEPPHPASHGLGEPSSPASAEPPQASSTVGPVGPAGRPAEPSSPNLVAPTGPAEPVAPAGQPYPVVKGLDGPDAPDEPPYPATLDPVSPHAADARVARPSVSAPEGAARRDGRASAG
ncbi:signal transduction histidine kinase [Streptomyces sp. B3I7]|uniref:ATP-binding protein n=1 Tax=Streptomyces sp. B3I7 TaxID=3042269 RepID=UPI002786E263|nr:ATP-binding protein [Streptomyces sp. B3I7]MDQ0809730.1 signal transduction histidine kinase [Streptomyces sp. B3I7]